MINSFRTKAVIGTLIVFVGIAAVAISSSNTVTKQIGSETFCVQRENLIEPSGWLYDITRHMRNDGFAFVLQSNLLDPSLNYYPAPNVNGAPIPMSGTVEPARNDEWLSRLPRDNYWRRIAEDSGAIIELDKKLHQIRAYQTPAKDRWMVWGIDPKLDLLPSSIAEGGSIVAHCDRTDFRSISFHAVDENVTCHRRVVRGDLLLSYSFGESNLSKVQVLDSEVWRVLLSWQCKNASNS